MFDLLCEFENLVVLKTIMDNVDINSINTAKLNEILDAAIELDIDLNCIDFDKIKYYSQYDLIESVYYEWFEDVNTMYLDTKNELLKLI